MHPYYILVVNTCLFFPERIRATMREAHGISSEEQQRIQAATVVVIPLSFAPWPQRPVGPLQGN